MDLDKQLLMAINDGDNINVVLDLISQGANVNAINNRETPLYAALKNASYTGKTYLINVLLENGADPNLLIPPYNKPVLAFEVGERFAKVLLEHGADPNVIGYMDKYTLLENNFRMRNVERFKLYLKYGAVVTPFILTAMNTSMSFPTNLPINTPNLLLNSRNEILNAQNAVNNAKMNEMFNAIRAAQIKQEMQDIQTGMREQATRTKSIKQSIHKLGQPPFVSDLISEYDDVTPAYKSMASPRTRSIIDKKWALNKKGGKLRQKSKKSNKTKNK